MPKTSETQFFLIDSTGRKFYTRKNGIPNDSWKGKGATTRIINKYGLQETHKRVDTKKYKPTMVTRQNLMSKLDFQEDINTPCYMSPASEAYWSM